MRKKRADLHVHTKYSDGTFTPGEAIECAKSKGLDCIAIVDHDSVNGLNEAMEAAGPLGIEVIPAVEISAEEGKREVHILGFCIDYKDEKLLGILKEIRDDRRKRLYKIVEALNRNGLNINGDDIIRSAGDVSISRLHIANYMKEKGMVSSWREAFTKYIGDTQACYVAGFKYSAREAINLIKEAKGIAVIAHPGLNKIDGLLPKLIEAGIEGIEAFHAEHRNSDSRRYEEYAREHNLLVSGGSDCHGMAKGRVLMGEVTVPYSYVEELKAARAKKG